MTTKEKKRLCIVFIGIVVVILGLIGAEQWLKKEIRDEKNDVTIQENQTVYNLPVVAIDLPDQRLKQGVKNSESNIVKAKINIYDNDIHRNQLSQKPTATHYAKIRIRGNSTKLVPKKQYKLYLTDSSYKKEEKATMLGMAKSDEWILNAPFEDKSLMRNVLAYEVGNEIMPWAPQTRYCEVFLRQKGEKGKMDQYYKGVYVMIEPVKRGKNRVNLDKSDSDYDQTSFIVQKNNTTGQTNIADSYGKENYLYDYPFIIDYPTKKQLTKGQKEYIEKTLSMFERSLYKNKKDREYEKYIDVDSFVDYFIINEFFNNTDAGLLSTYMYKDYGSKIYAGPIWDFNASLGNSDLISPYYDYKGFYISRTPIFDKLLEHKEFVRKVIWRYRILRKSYLSDNAILMKIDRIQKSLGDAPQRNFEHWPIWLCNQFEMFKEYQDVFLPMGDNVQKITAFLKEKKNRHYLKSTDNMATSYKEEIKKLKVFVVNRGRWMDDNINELYDFTGEKNEDNE